MKKKRDDKEEEKKEWVKKKKKKKIIRRRERERGYIYKKGESEREWVSQLALQTMALHFSRKTFHRLALPNLALARLQSLAITLIRCQLCIASLAAPTHAKEEECSSYDIGLCYSNPFGTCSYAKKGDILCTSNPKSIVPTDHATKVYGFYTLAVCTTWPWLFAWVGMVWVPSSTSAHIKRRNRQQPYATMPPLQQLQDFHLYMLLVSTLRYVLR